MKAFEKLTYRGQFGRLKQLAEAALACYPVAPTRIIPLVHLENTTFRIATNRTNHQTNQPTNHQTNQPTNHQTNQPPNHPPNHPTASLSNHQTNQYTLRINRPYHRDADAIRSEMLWLSALRQETDLVVPEPVVNREGDLVTTTAVPGVPEPRHCVLFKWVPGRFVRRRIAPVHLERVGAFTARLHQHAESFHPPPGFIRHDVEWGDAEQPGEMERLMAIGLQVGAEVITPADRETFLTVREQVRAGMAAVGRERSVYGIIHADLHLGNCLFQDGRVNAIDFDDCGWGHYLYDAAVTLWYLRGRPDFETLRGAYLQGYRRVRPLSPDHESLLELFTASRTLLMAMWMAGRVENPRLRQFAPRFVANGAADLRAFLAGEPQRGARWV